MKAAVYYENGGPEVFKYEDMQDPICKANEVLIKIKSISIEGGDLINREIRPLPQVPNIVGYQCAGEIIKVGIEVKDRFVGQRVVSLGNSGSHAQFIAVETFRTYPIPEGLSYESASAIPVAFVTAHECLFGSGNLKARETVLIHGGTGSLGLAAIQMASQAGAIVIATGSDETKLKKLLQFGAGHVINYKTQSIVNEVMAITKNVGVDLVIDSVGGKNLALSAEALAYRGRIAFVGLSSREPNLFDPFLLWKQNATLHGVFLPGIVETEKKETAELLAEIFKDVVSGKLIVTIDQTFPLSKVRDAHQYVEERKGFGRVLLNPEL
ncbi:quinone oxidoreductase family protein [Dyadobacter frigoris]|uniref:Zinc-binding alcohol dehydrogenase family protein n=1 Tax=Dyadobacter frigoris TaxID=2576211 RepID=A0A4U6DAE7_9BACT|nr:zinc-binding alcohol dehydrogenase family protein [Dyadobacter frigoris]TKT93371.1 zinc-binding alcohol dehydrogenase family protein [Dyadobacter frigoris]GLU54684.1 NADP-dependent oxidoreductase [Dyadobacter frigoris]